VPGRSERWGVRGASRLRRDAPNIRGVWGALRGPPCSTGETAKGDPLVIRPLLRARPLQRVRDALVQSAVARAPPLDREDGHAQGGRAALGIRLGAGAVDEGDETCGRDRRSGCGRAGDRDEGGSSADGHRAGASDTAHAGRPEQLQDAKSQTSQSRERSE
jgi:hypothetical protein